MKILTFNRYREHYHHADVDRLREVARRHGYTITSNDVIQVWREHSETMAAGWLMLDLYTDDDLMNVLLQYTDVDDVEAYASE